ncbi:hypothetical protein PV05_00514 [Exophiala xenobiotica]|uniref:Uncharacterized protein n=1 Tax=Exophiala xenobiotica TaxID=348802 RepID=A0A0D2FJG7_9EURO|nr:uncharacterized protein PV05_00514 [Exophiala xenobiotica]KIW60284.1 hypothetical protein PV05_00514 [Exophiala xenobiotica]
MRAKIWSQWEKKFKTVDVELDRQAPCCLISQGLLEQAGLDHPSHNEVQCPKKCHQETIKLSVRENQTPAGCRGRQACVITFCILECKEPFALMTGQEELWMEEAPSKTIAILVREKRSKAKKEAIARQLPAKEAQVAEKERQQSQKSNRQPDGQSQAQGVQPHAPQHQGNQRK